MPDPTWISLLPPLLAIELAICTRQVYLSLAAGVWLGWTVLSGWNPLAGLGADAAPLLADIDDVVHFAGLTDFEPDPLMALAANVRGARHAADLAALSRGRIYLHVSTAFVAGVDTDDVREHIERGLAPNGVRFSPERELQDLEAELGRLERKQDRIDACMARAQRLGWPNVYTYTKGLAEHLLEGRQDVRAATFRHNAEDILRLNEIFKEMAQGYPGLTLPIEILHGSEDDVVTESISPRGLERDAANTTFTLLDGVGHMPHHADPAAAVAAIARAAGEDRLNAARRKAVTIRIARQAMMRRLTA